MAAGFSLTMLVTVPPETPTLSAKLAELHSEAGFTKIEAHPVPNSPHTVVTGIAQ